MADIAENRGRVLDGAMMGVGTWAWGDRLYWGYGSTYHKEDLFEVFERSLEKGITLFDTAEVYSLGGAETILGEFVRRSDGKALVATKFMPFPWRLNRAALFRALRHSLSRMGLSCVDLYQMHFPLPPINIETWMEYMVEAVQAGMTRSVGVSNYDRGEMQRAYDVLMKNGIQLESNQLEYSIMNRKIEKNGLLAHCQQLGVRVIAYTPLASGMLSGKYSPENPPKGMRSGRYTLQLLKRIQPLIHLLRRLGEEHGGKTPAQVALNWTIAKGTIPIPGAKNLMQADQNAAALGWLLSPAEVAEIDETADRIGPMLE